MRLSTWDYTLNGAYFITICTDRRESLFDDERYRVIVQQVWRHITIRSRKRQGDAFVVMPNHVHGIIWITSADGVGAQHTRQRNAAPKPDDRSMARCSSVTGRVAPLRGRDNGGRVVEPDSLGAVVRAFKAACARRINEVRGMPGAAVWQRGYHDRVLRNDAELNRARGYILDNPRRWAEDPLNPGNGFSP
jgi:REP element-mobilizing transposase RayT